MQFVFPLFNVTKGIAMNKDQVKGRVEEVKGKVKEVAGDLVGNKSLEVEGLIQKTTGKIQAGLGDAKSEAKNTP